MDGHQSRRMRVDCSCDAQSRSHAGSASQPRLSSKKLMKPAAALGKHAVALAGNDSVGGRVPVSTSDIAAG